MFLVPCVTLSPLLPPPHRPNPWETTDFLPTPPEAPHQAPAPSAAPTQLTCAPDATFSVRSHRLRYRCVLTAACSPKGSRPALG